MKVATILAFVAAVAIAAPVADPMESANMDVAEFEAREVEAADFEFDAREADVDDEDLEDFEEFEAREEAEVDAADVAAAKNIPTLGKTQSNNARAIFAEIKKTKVGHRGCLAVFATALVESNVYIYANRGVPKSLKYHHDKIGSDHDSIGIFQQRARYYPDIKKDMSPAGSAGQFISKMKGVKGWKTMSTGKLCQKVQVSAYPTRYSQRVAQAKKICKAGGF